MSSVSRPLPLSFIGGAMVGMGSGAFVFATRKVSTPFATLTVNREGFVLSMQRLGEFHLPWSAVSAIERRNRKLVKICHREESVPSQVIFIASDSDDVIEQITSFHKSFSSRPLTVRASPPPVRQLRCAVLFILPVAFAILGLSVAARLLPPSPWLLSTEAAEIFLASVVAACLCLTCLSILIVPAVQRFVIHPERSVRDIRVWLLVGVALTGLYAVLGISYLLTL